MLTDFHSDLMILINIHPRSTTFDPPKLRCPGPAVHCERNFGRIHPIIKPRIPIQVKKSRRFCEFFDVFTGNLGFHRPNRVVPPTAASPRSPPSQPPSYSARTPYFPSHFFPEKLHHYWQYYYPRIPGNLDMDTKSKAHMQRVSLFR